MDQSARSTEGTKGHGFGLPNLVQPWGSGMKQGLVVDDMVQLWAGSSPNLVVVLWRLDHYGRPGCGFCLVMMVLVGLVQMLEV